LARVVLVLSIVMLAWAIRTTRLTAFEAHRESQTYEDVYYLPPAEWLPVLSMGYRSAAADLLWCRSLVYFGEEFLRKGTVKHLFNYANAIIALDPDFKSVYPWVATAAMYRAGEFDVKEAMHAADYLRTAVRRWPDDGKLAWELGSMLKFEIYPYVGKDPALGEKISEEAAQHLSAAALMGAGPAWLALNSSSLLQRLGKTEQAIQHLEEVYGSVQDESVKAEIAERLASLRSEAYAAAVREANDQFEAQRAASYPYLSSTMFLLLGSKASRARFDMLKRDFLPADPVDQVFDEAEHTAQGEQAGSPASKTP
jgi:hypothetical protein